MKTAWKELRAVHALVSSCSRVQRGIVDGVLQKLMSPYDSKSEGEIQANKGGCDLIILHGYDATEWTQYLVDLFATNHQGQDLVIENYEINGTDKIQDEDLKTMKNAKCILTLLSGELLDALSYPNVLEFVQKALRPPNKVVVLLCGVIECDDFTNLFEDWTKWIQLTSDDDPELYVNAVRNSMIDDSGCDSVTDTDAEGEDQASIYSKHFEFFHQPMSQEKQGNLISVQPERIRCGVKTQIYIILKCKLDTSAQIKNEVYFNPLNGRSVRVPATLQNEYIITADAPDLPSGLVFLKVFAGDLIICEARITYFTDMEEISYLLDNATNPVEFMCQAFKIVPYNIETLDKLLTESLKNNIPASGIHLFGINQIEEENLSANQRDEELPTLLHFSAKYGLKNLTALLLTCPGALQAYSVSNKHGDFPNNKAEKHGYRDLRQFIDEYVETADMLRTHIKEELMHDGDNEDGDNDSSTYASMASFSTDLLMKCSLNPGCSDYLYESMAGLVPQYDAEDTYVDMMQAKGASPSLHEHKITTKDSVIRKILEGGNVDHSGEEDVYHLCKDEDVYDTVQEGSQHTEVVSRPPVPVPRPTEPQDTEPFISKVFIDKTQTRRENVYVESSKPMKIDSSVKLRRDRPQSSVYDPFVGMKTPGQRELITLQERVKLGMISVDEALLQFREWQLNQTKRSDSFRYQQENLKKLRDSISRRQNENKKQGKKSDLEITKPIRRGQAAEVKLESAVYESGPISSAPPKKAITRGNWKTDSTSSTASSASNRSSTRSTLSVSSGMEGDNEDNEIADYPKRQSHRVSLTEEKPPPRPPRIPNQSSKRSPPATSGNNWTPPPVPPRGR
ncbi:phosphoinositide 3-kinase adapter protein 1 [Pelodytes ibericus]